jgi:ADP-ribose pyrophosphatase YjhB (NUDIX family)
MCAKAPSQARSSDITRKFFPLSQVKLRKGDKVAAVCYRMNRGEAEFLLVRTRGGRWTFPKGRVEPGLTHAQAAALEAFEEAGVHGRMAEVPLARYVLRKGRDSGAVVSAYLCQVLRIGPAQEANRNPTWFSAVNAERRLRKDRGSHDGTELAGVIQHALLRIRLHNNQSAVLSSQTDPLQRVEFEAPPSPGVWRQAAVGLTISSTRILKLSSAQQLELAGERANEVIEGGRQQRLTLIRTPKLTKGSG